MYMYYYVAAYLQPLQSPGFLAVSEAYTKTVATALRPTPPLQPSRVLRMQSLSTDKALLEATL